MWFWQRREVFTSDSMREFNRARDILEQSRVPYDYRLRSRTPLYPGRSPESGRWGTGAEFGTVYRIYVKEEDLDAARRALGR
ncbi:MAG: DUF2007 domain-containing protein [Oscillospiraceae bacterium]|jgi:hypothetical protein|nr:DUF2007 domain-containing protein [Oscillospiraceae bacterium]MCI1990233.1 DUF2007 domain-containing protein [Oscillospiraceae bacterium]MCI2035783.1 DUF2007 domain-containing protein [Oscillospiraceae bacterium]